MSKGGTLTYLHGDHLGSASMATDGSGAMLNEGAFKPFGEPLGSSTFANDKTYTGQRVDSATGGLMDYNARFYSPVLGRFVSADSIVPGAGNPQALNRYAYTINNPLKYKDPSGHCYGEATSANENFAGCPSSTPEDSKRAARIIILGSTTFLACNFGGCGMIGAGIAPDLFMSVINRLEATDYDWAWSLQDMLTADTLDELLSSGVSNLAQGGTSKIMGKINSRVYKKYPHLKSPSDKFMETGVGMLAGIATACTFGDCIGQAPGYPDGYYAINDEGFSVAGSGNGTSGGTGFMLDKTFIGKFKFSSDLASNFAARFVTGLITDQNSVIEFRERYRQEKQFPAIVTLFHNQSTIHSPLTGPQ